jgi:methionine-rich copper-binding protein CopC
MSSSGCKTIVALLVSAVIAGCAGSGNGLDANGNPGSGDLGPLTADFQSIQDHIFTPICSGCHGGADPPKGLRLDAEHSYTLLVGMPSAESDLLRVKASDPDNSYLIHKLEGNGISGDQMPRGGPFLLPPTIAVIRQWISAGATRGTSTTNPEAAVKAIQHFGVNFTSPADQSISSESVSQIMLEFNGEIDSNLINETTVAVARIDAPDQTVPVAIATSIPAGNPSAIRPNAPLQSGTYQVSLQGSLANMNAQALGADYSFMFTVDVLR